MMIRLIIPLLVFLASNSVFCQIKALEEALSDGKNRDGMYKAEFHKYTPDSDIAQWINHNNMVVLEKDEGAFKRFGDEIDGIYSISFMTEREYNILLAQEEKRLRERRSDDGLAMLVGGAIALGLIFEGGKWLLKNTIGSGPSSSSSSSNTSIQGAYSILEGEYNCNVSKEWESESFVSIFVYDDGIFSSNYSGNKDTYFVSFYNRNGELEFSTSDPGEDKYEFGKYDLPVEVHVQFKESHQSKLRKVAVRFLNPAHIVSIFIEFNTLFCSIDLKTSIIYADRFYA